MDNAVLDCDTGDILPFRCHDESPLEYTVFVLNDDGHRSNPLKHDFGHGYKFGKLSEDVFRPVVRKVVLDFFSDVPVRIPWNL